MNIVQLDRGSAVKEDTCRIRIAETLSQVDHQEGNDNKKVWFLQLLLFLRNNSAVS